MGSVTRVDRGSGGVAVMRWYDGTMVRRYDGTVVQRYGGEDFRCVWLSRQQNETMGVVAR